MNNVFKVGMPYIPALGLGEGARFSIGEDGAFLLYGFDRPTASEVAAVDSGQGFEIRFVTIGGIIWILTKCGSLNWTDSPYNPRLSSEIPVPESITDGAGLSLMLVMLDSRDAIVKSVRLIGLGTDFSRRLLSEVQEVRKQTMTIMQASLSIQRTMASYPTSKLVKMAPTWARFKL